MLDDKDAAGMLRELLPLCGEVDLHRERQPARAAAGDARSRWPASSAARRRARSPDPRGRSSAARAAAGPDGVALVTGSIYLIADLLRPARRASARRMRL